MSDTEPKTPNGRTAQDAILEAERILNETLERYDENASAEWMLVRLTKALEALADRPAPITLAASPLNADNRTA
jgi:hypothetical protein